MMNTQFASIVKFLVISTLLVSLSACDLLGRKLSQEEMNVYFYKPDGEEIYLGVTRGIHICRNTVLEKAKQFGFEGDGGMPANAGKNDLVPADETNTTVGEGWTYHCCWKVVTDTCKQKLK